MVGASSGEAGSLPEDPTVFGVGTPYIEDALPAATPGPAGLVRQWMVCTLRHRRAHRWFQRYLGGYGRCSACGREWD